MFLTTVSTLGLHIFSRPTYLTAGILDILSLSFMIATAALLFPRVSSCPSSSSSDASGYTPALSAIPSKADILSAFPNLADARSYRAWLMRVRSTCTQMTASASLSIAVAVTLLATSTLAFILYRRVGEIPGMLANPDEEDEWKPLEIRSVGGRLEEEIERGMMGRNRGSAFMDSSSSGRMQRPGGFERVHTSDSVRSNRSGRGGEMEEVEITMTPDETEWEQRWKQGTKRGRESTSTNGGPRSGEWVTVGWEGEGGYYGTQRGVAV